jgi:hypothetical protein
MGESRPNSGRALAILPGLTHDNIARSPLLAAATLAFLAQITVFGAPCTAILTARTGRRNGGTVHFAVDGS